MKKSKSKFTETMAFKAVHYFLYVDNKLIVRTESKETLIEQYEFQRSYFGVSSERIKICKEVYSLFNYQFIN